MKKWSIQVLVLILMSVITYGQTNSFSKIDFVIGNWKLEWKREWLWKFYIKN
ncbi:MAG: hypothetical protein KKF62_09360 [Bacteroidetes bacterium]|nr:hypothetical protein [Bacteroidota bacterium]MBU1116746.1 hypothetical protein [Bacteroidota bacterium]MBU1798145.1 hypothetical protein [Bacteroidota bacterium]